MATIATALSSLVFKKFEAETSLNSILQSRFHFKMALFETSDTEDLEKYEEI